MIIKIFNFWYFFWIITSFLIYFGLYKLLKNKNDKTKKIVLFGVLILGLVLHFTKSLYPPYSVDEARKMRDLFFINICGANIALFPFLFVSKSDKAKDYMFYIGVISGIISVLVPIEPINKIDQLGETFDIIRFYLHHTMLWVVPLLMVQLKLHKLNYKRILCVPTYLLLVMLFIILNQFFQSELGFIPLRDDNFFNINFKNSSMIYGPTSEKGIMMVLIALCPKIFKTVPYGTYAGQKKYWPWFWLIVPCYVILTPAVFLISLIFDFQHFKYDYQNVYVPFLKNITSVFKSKKLSQSISNQNIDESNKQLNESADNQKND